jgi:lysophospholipid acyltransferase (LPLAT)-like uncharacterized protein
MLRYSFKIFLYLGLMLHTQGRENTMVQKNFRTFPFAIVPFWHSQLFLPLHSRFTILFLHYFIVSCLRAHEAS